MKRIYIFSLLLEPDFLVPRFTVIPIGKGMAGIAAERMEVVQVCNLQMDKFGVIMPPCKRNKGGRCNHHSFNY